MARNDFIESNNDSLHIKTSDLTNKIEKLVVL